MRAQVDLLLALILFLQLHRLLVLSLFLFPILSLLWESTQGAIGERIGHALMRHRGRAWQLPTPPAAPIRSLLRANREWSSDAGQESDHESGGGGSGSAALQHLLLRRDFLHYGTTPPQLCRMAPCSLARLGLRFRAGSVLCSATFLYEFHFRIRNEPQCSHGRCHIRTPGPLSMSSLSSGGTECSRSFRRLWPDGPSSPSQRYARTVHRSTPTGAIRISLCRPAGAHALAP